MAVQRFDEIKEYTTSVCNQIRWKKAHPIISREIENHLLDQRDAYLADGDDEITSIEKAIEQMGDPVTVGAQLDRTHRPHAQWDMILLTIFLLMMGLILNYFVNRALANTLEVNYFMQAVLATMLGSICMVVAYFIDFTIIGKYPKIIFSLPILFLITVYPFAGIVGGTGYWMLPIFGGINTAFILLLSPTAYAGVIYSMRNRGYVGILGCGIIYGIALVVLLKVTNNFSATFVCTILCLILLTVSICEGYFKIERRKGLCMVYIPTALALVFDSFMMPNAYIAGRLDSLRNPSLGAEGWGYTMTITRDMISGARFFGQGTLPSNYAGEIASWLPSISTDYLITYLIHRAGWISFLIIVAVLVAFVIRGFRLCLKQKSALGKLVSMSVMLTLTAQGVIYIAANLGFQLFSLFSLPLISYSGIGGMAINLGLIGIMLSVFRTGYLVRDRKMGTTDANKKMFEFADGKLTIDFGRR